MHSSHTTNRSSNARGLRGWMAVGAIALAVSLTTARDAGAQRSGATVQLLGSLGPDSLVVSILTMGQGEELFDRFGHMSLRVRNVRTGLDSAWNWGMYDFNSPNFIPRFLTGDTRYWMAGFPSPFLVNYYQRQGRAVWEQTLDLDRQEADSLLTFLRWQARDENKFYRYDYYLDNCSTRVRDAIDAVLGGGLRRAMTGPGRTLTWRGETLRLAADFPVTGFGMTFALGPRADVPMSAWEELFVPMRLRDAIKELNVTRPLGQRALVRSEQLLVAEGKFTEASAAPTFTKAALLLGLVLAGAFMAFGGMLREPAWARVTFAVAASAWHLVAGLAGTLVLLAGLFTRHVFMATNANVLLGTPVSIALAVLILLSGSSRHGERMLKAATALALFTAAAALLSLASHSFAAVSPRDIAPAVFGSLGHTAIAFALYWRSHGQGEPT